MNNINHTLLAITGLSPQVVTETLYGIHKQGLPWPNELIILTTQQGAEQAKLGLCHPASNQEHSMLDRCCIDLKRPQIRDIKIEVVPDHAGNSIDDARTKEDQEALADYIVKRVAQLCSDPQRILHASLAGGRKTMTFFLGYAMTLFARPDDRLSHVLIAPAEYEGLRDFYYPTPYTKAIDGKGTNQKLDTHEEKVNVILADIPFIRQRDQLKKGVLHRFSNPQENLTYRQLVHLQQLASCKDPYQEIHINFDLTQRTVELNYKNEHVLTINMENKPLELAYYAMVARHNSISSEKRYNRERANNKLSWANYRAVYLHELWQIIYPDHGPYQGSNIFEDWINLINTKAETIYIEKTINGLKEETQTFFDDRKKVLRKHLNEELPEELVSVIEPDLAFYYEKFTNTHESKNKDSGSLRPNFNFTLLKQTDKKSKNANSLIERSKFFGLKVRSNLCPKD